jgi:hypothetical protein
MTKFHFKQAGVFHLQKLKYLLSELTGVRYHLNEPESLNSLIMEAMNCSDERVIQEFSVFHANCWPCTQEYISSKLMARKIA